MQHAAPVVTDARIREAREDAPGIHYLKITAPAIAGCARPGQFIMVQVPAGGTDPLLRRPFSLAGADGGALDLLVQVRGAGTALLAARGKAGVLNVFGPFGNGFTVPDAMTEALLIGGGMGIAPLLFLADVLRRRRPACRVRIFFGAATQATTQVLERFPLLRDCCSMATEDGSRGIRGTAVDLVDAYRAQQPAAGHAGVCMYGCGPQAMLAALAARARAWGVACQMAFEAMMACGVGACMGCTVADHAGAYRRVCADGPVFDAFDMFYYTGKS